VIVGGGIGDVEADGNLIEEGEMVFEVTADAKADLVGARRSAIQSSAKPMASLQWI
jgi:hypothetical protein